jgi:16S rRNA (guanine966-N2)-methyltransferase
MRVISGALKGRTLRVPGDATFRPTTDRVKEALFNILNGLVDWEHCHACDLFAGSGSLGIEALSRGAIDCCFVEQSRASLAVLERNVNDLSLAERVNVVRRSVEGFLADACGRYTLLLADPPYRYPRVTPLLDGMAGLLEDDAVAVLEHETDLRLGDTATLRAFDRREYGSTAVTFFQPIHGGRE